MGASCCRSPLPAEIRGLYKRRRPEQTDLYKLLLDQLETFFAHYNKRFLPRHGHLRPEVRRTLKEFIQCGVLRFGFGRCFCPNCGHGFAVAFSCKTRGLCPSCNGRRMAQTGAHIINHVMPRVPVRQVVLSVPKRLRWFLHQDPKVVSGVMRVFLRTLSTAIRKHSPDAPREAKMGAVSFFHRGGSSLNVHPHFHNVVADGVFALGTDGQAVFFPATDLYY